MNKVLPDVDALKQLVDQLNRSPKIVELNKRYSKPEETPEAWTLAHAFRDIGESSHKIFAIILPKLMHSNPNGQETTDLLLDIGEEFRHILYHIRDPKFFEYLFPVEDPVRGVKEKKGSPIRRLVSRGKTNP